MNSRIKLTDYETDKSVDYLKRYDDYFQSLIQKKIYLLELGINKGGSLLLWQDYFKAGTIVGLDIKPITLKKASDRMHIYQGLQQDKRLLDKIREDSAPGGFDIIIDDASHIGELTRASFWHLFDKHLKPGGIYVIEDWRTGYWGKWPDGRQYNSRPYGLESINSFLARITRRRVRKRLKSHDYGMVGLVKQLVDELGMDMITNPARGGKMPFRKSRFQKMEIFPGQVFIVKGLDERL